MTAHPEPRALQALQVRQAQLAHPGISCWDLNANGQADPEEDVTGDGVVDVADCNAVVAGAYEGEQLHQGYFTDHDYEGTGSCLNCHGFTGADMLTKAHFTWQGVASNIAGLRGRDPRQERPDQQLLYRGPDQRRPLHRVSCGVRLRRQDL